MPEIFEKLCFLSYRPLVNNFIEAGFLDSCQGNTPQENYSRFLGIGKFRNSRPKDSLIKLGIVVDKKPSLDYSQKIIDDFLKKNFTEGQDFFLFAYDWRRDLEDTANLDDPKFLNPSLKQEIDEIFNSSKADKINIIAHSQGGLVLKKFLQTNPEYQEKINKIVFVGVPNLGAPKAAKVLLYGDSMGVEFLGMGLDPDEVKKISQNMPSVYELLPSKKYFDYDNFYLRKGESISEATTINHVTPLNFEQTKQYLSDAGKNITLINHAPEFHESIDALDFSEMKDKIFNIVGCQAATIGKIFIRSDGEYFIDYLAGDGTVPYFSANNINNAKTYFALDSSHASMLTGEGTRQQILNIVLDLNNDTQEKITENISECHFNGTQVSAHSPVILHIYDQNGHHVGPTSEGGFDYEIPGVAYDTINHESFAFLPQGENYTVKLIATDTGSVNFYSTKIVEGQKLSENFYNQISVATGTSLQLPISDSENSQMQILNASGDRINYIAPSANLNQNQILDTKLPETTIILSGNMQKSGIFTGNVQMDISAKDAILENLESQTSGILNTYFKIDDLNWQQTNTATTVNISEIGNHLINFYSIDKAGNKEPNKTLDFKISQLPKEGPKNETQASGGVVLPILTKAPELIAGTSTVITAFNITKHLENDLIVDESGTVFIIKNNILRPFTSAKRFLELGFKFNKVVRKNQEDKIYFLGMPI